MSIALPRALPMRLLAWFALALFLVFSFAWLSQPGPYYDEWIFVPVSLRTLGECDIAAAVTHHLGCLPLTQSPPYVGAIKAWLMAPVFGVFGVDAWSVRVPPILLGLVTLVLVHRHVRERLGAWAAAGVLLVLAVDPAFVWHTRLDWGPVAIANLCKVAGFFALLRWIANGRTGDLALLLAALCVGLFDKLNFLWVTLAFGFAALVVEPRALASRLRTLPRTQWLMVIVAAAVHAFGLVTLVLPAMSMPLPGIPDEIPLDRRFVQLWHLYNHTFGGTSVYGWIFAAELPVQAWPALVQSVLMLATPFVLWHVRGSQAPAAHLLRWSSAVLIGLFACLLATRQVGGSHHLIVAWPFPVLQAASLAMALIERHPRAAFGRAVAIAGALAVVLVAAIFLRTDLAHVNRLSQNGPYRPLFDPAIEDVSDALRGATPHVVASRHWGLHQGLLSLARRGERTRYQDWWAIFVDPPDADPPRTEYLRTAFLADRRFALVEWIGDATLAGNDHAEAYLAAWQACLRDTREFTGSGGTPIVRVREYFVPAEGTCEAGAP